MKRKLNFILLIVVLTFLGGTQKTFAQRSLQAAVNSYIAKAAAAQQGEEYRKDRKVVLGDLDGDGDKDAVVQYTLEGMGGGNNFAQMLVAALTERGFDAFLDKTDIAPGEPWKERLAGLIAAADTVVFAVSPDSVA